MIHARYIYCALYFYYYYIVIYNEIIIQPTIMQNHWEPWACFHLPLTDRVLMRVCSQTSLLTIICICSHSPALASPPQLHLRSSGIRFSQGAHNLDPLHAQFTVGFMLLWESNAASDLTGGGVQAVMRAVGSGCKYRWSFTLSPTAHLLPWGPIPNRPQGLGTPARQWEYLHD